MKRKTTGSSLFKVNPFLQKLDTLLIVAQRDMEGLTIQLWHSVAGT